MQRRSLIALAFGAAIAVPAMAAPLVLPPLTIRPDRPAETAPAIATQAAPLSSAPGIVLTRAYGPEDEDCIFKVTRTADGLKQRELICR